MSAKMVVIAEPQTKKGLNDLILAVFDDKGKMDLLPGNPPYEFDISPGKHQLIFYDPSINSGVEGLLRKIAIRQTKGGIALGLGLVGLGAGLSFQGFDAGQSVANALYPENGRGRKFKFSVNDGSTITISCKRIKTGKIEVKQVGQ